MLALYFSTVVIVVLVWITEEGERIIGKWTGVRIDDRVPVDSAGLPVIPVFYGPQNEIWPFLLTKALLKASRSNRGLLHNDFSVLQALLGESELVTTDLSAMPSRLVPRAIDDALARDPFGRTKTVFLSCRRDAATENDREVRAAGAHDALGDASLTIGGGGGGGAARGAMPTTWPSAGRGVHGGRFGCR